MPKINRVRAITALPTPVHPPKRIDNPSPDGEWNLVVHSPGEWHMGADGWKVKLFHRSRDVTAQHKDFFRIADGRGFRWEEHFYPWSFDSKSLVMVTWDKTPVHLYEVATRRDKQLDYQPAFVRTAQWAPDMDRLLITLISEGLLVDRAGKQQALVQWVTKEGEGFHAFWMKTGNCFFHLGRQSADSKTRLTFHSGVDGASKETYDLDPIDLVPYRWQDYVELRRDTWSLQWVEPRIESVGSMLDVWNTVRFDRATNTLFLAVVRPVSPPFEERGELVCTVKQVWIAAELDPN